MDQREGNAATAGDNPREKYAALLRASVSLGSVPAVAQSIGVSAVHLQDILYGHELPSISVHTALLQAVYGARPKPHSFSATAVEQLSRAYANAVVRRQQSGPMADGRIVLLTLGAVPVRLLTALADVIAVTAEAHGYTDITVDPGGRVTARRPA